MTSENFIYGLIDPRDGELRYVGLSATGFDRPFKHWKNKKTRERNDHPHCWVRSVLASGYVPEIEIIEEHEGGLGLRERLNEAEIFWIAYFKMIGCRLTNHTLGGGGTMGISSWIKGKTHTPETRAKISVGNKGRVPYSKGKKVHPNLSAAIIESNKNRVWTDEDRTRVGKQASERVPWNKGKKFPYRPNTKIADALRGIKRSEEFKKNISEKKKQWWAERRSK